MSRLIAELLRDRVRAAGAGPLVTGYDLASGQRVELSGTTFANWVAKTANLLESELLVEPGDPVALPLAASDPGHWVTAVWQVACWQVGAVVSLDWSQPAALVVCGPAGPVPRGAAEVVVCSLHPLALGLGVDAPPGVIDFDRHVRGQPDTHTPAALPADAPAWRDDERRLSQADLLAGVGGRAERRLVRPTAAWPTARAGIVTALLTGGSYVVVSGEDPDRLAEIRTRERISAG